MDGELKNLKCNISQLSAITGLWAISNVVGTKSV